jgi:ABC-type molybdate transport system substrate-binding protein
VQARVETWPFDLRHYPPSGSWPERTTELDPASGGDADAAAPSCTEDIPLAHFNLYRSKGGYGYEVTYPEGREYGWRPTRGWAKRAAQHKVLEVMDIDPSVKPTFAPTNDERLFSQGSGHHRRRFDPFHNGGIWIVAVVLVIGILAASAVFLVRRNSKDGPVFSGPLVMTMYANSRLQPVLGTVINDFKLLHPEINVITVYGTSQDFQNRAQKNDFGDIYIDSPASFGWITNYIPPDGSETQMGYDVLEMVVRSSNANSITGMDSVTHNSSLKLGLCSAFIPCGLAAQSVLKSASVKQGATMPNAKDAKTNIDRVALGNVDISFVFRTDYSLHPVPGLTPVDLDTQYQARADYQVRRGKNKAITAQEFIDFLQSSAGSASLHRVGLLST